MTYPTPQTHRPSLEDFQKASKRLEGIAIRTPLTPLKWYHENPEILLKLEKLQPIGSYKIRGVYNWTAQLDAEKRSKGISTVSSGNMAQAVAYVGKLYGIPSRTVILDYAAKSKAQAAKKYGAEVIILPFNDALDYANNPPSDRCFLHPLTEYGLLDGHGTIGLEIMEDAPDTETIYVPLGAGFLGAGVALAAKALKPSVRVVGVKSESSPHFYESIKLGKAVETERKPTLAEAISSLATEDRYLLIEETIDEVVLVSEEKIEEAIRYLALENKLVVEGAGAISLAAALETPKGERGKTVCILSGGSIDSDVLSKILQAPRI